MNQDTAPSQRVHHHELLRMTPAKRLAKATPLSANVRVPALAEIRLRRPGVGTAELRSRLAVRLFGRDVARRLCKDIPDDAI